MKKIDVSTPRYPNVFAIVDDEDFIYLNEWNWNINSRGYAVRKFRNNERRVQRYMHRDILKPSTSQDVDHINGEKLDNRRENIRACSHTENMRNSKKPKSGLTSMFKGVIAYKGGKNKFRAVIRANGKAKHLGLFENECDAARAYNMAASKYYGEFALLNKIEERA